VQFERLGAWYAHLAVAKLAADRSVGGAMRLLVVSHPCVTPINQSFFAALQKETNWAVTIVAPTVWHDDYGQRIRLDRWPAYQGRLIGLPVMQSGNIPLHLYRARASKLLHDERPDVIYVHHEPYALATAQWFMANTRSGRRPIGFYAAQNIYKRYPPPFRQLERYVLHRSAFALPVTDAAAEVLRLKGYAGSATVLPLPVDTELFRPSPEAATALRREFHLHDDAPTIGYLGRLVPEKGLQTLVEAVGKLPQDEAWQVVIGGSGPMETQLHEFVSRMGCGSRVRFVGFVPRERASAFLSALDILVAPSESRANWTEQFGRVLTEGLACGTPFIGTDCGEIPQIASKTSGGVIVPEHEPDALAGAVTRLIRDRPLRLALAIKGRERVLQEFALPVVVQRFAEVIEASFSQPSWGRGAC
jgi:glycosyltransferase involved in cell wall biosynthesis